MSIKACLISPSKHLKIEVSGVGAKFVVPILRGIHKLNPAAILFQPMESPLKEFQPKDRAPELLEKKCRLFFLFSPENKK